MRTYFPIVVWGAILVGCSSSNSPGGGDITGSGGSGGSTGVVGGLPPACSIFTQDLCAKVTTKPLKQGGKETAAGPQRLCQYDGSDGSFLPALCSLGTDNLTPAERNDACLHPPLSGIEAGQVVMGVGTWACFHPASAAGSAQILDTGNGRYEIILNGNAALEQLEQVATEGFARLAM